MPDFTIECSVEAIAGADHFTRLCQHDVIVASAYPVHNPIFAVAEPISVHLLELVKICLGGRTLSRTPHVVLVATAVEESAVIS